jgi:hypothetical protein
MIERRKKEQRKFRVQNKFGEKWTGRRKNETTKNEKI